MGRLKCCMVNLNESLQGQVKQILRVRRDSYNLPKLVRNLGFMADTQLTSSRHVQNVFLLLFRKGTYL